MNFGALSYWLLMLFMALCLFLTWYFFRNKSETFKRRYIFWIGIAGLALFVFYKTSLALATDYEVFTLGRKFDPWRELPLQLCYINLMLIPVVAYVKWDHLRAFVFFTGPLGGLLAMISPEKGFELTHYSLFLARNIGFYGIHFIMIFCGISLALLKMYRPKMKSVIPVFTISVGISLFIHFCNFILRQTGISPTANYCYTFGPEGVFILEKFRSWIHLDYFYLVFAIVFLAIYCAIIILPFHIIDVFKKRKSSVDKPS